MILLVVLILLTVLFFLYKKSTFKNKYKCIILVASSNIEEFYKEPRNIWKKYMNLNPDIKVFFVYGKNTSEGLQIENNIDLVYDIEEKHKSSGFLKKTLKAMEYINENYEYDYILRTNSTCFWDLNKLVYTLDELPKNNIYYGKKLDHEAATDFVSGSDYLLSKDVIKQLLDTQNDIDYNITEWDDVTLGYHLTNTLNIPITPQPENKYVWIEKMPENLDSYLENLKNAGCTHYRIKIENDRVNNDLIVHKKLLKLIYNLD
jgi:hypothetical protein